MVPMVLRKRCATPASSGGMNGLQWPVLLTRRGPGRADDITGTAVHCAGLASASLPSAKGCGIRVGEQVSASAPGRSCMTALSTVHLPVRLLLIRFFPQFPNCPAVPRPPTVHVVVYSI